MQWVAVWCGQAHSVSTSQCGIFNRIEWDLSPTLHCLNCWSESNKPLTSLPSPFKVLMNGNYSEMIFPAYLVEILSSGPQDWSHWASGGDERGTTKWWWELWGLQLPDLCLIFCVPAGEESQSVPPSGHTASRLIGWNPGHSSHWERQEILSKFDKVEMNSKSKWTIWLPHSISIWLFKVLVIHDLHSVLICYSMTTFYNEQIIVKNAFQMKK